MVSRCFSLFTSIRKNPPSPIHFLRRSSVCVCVWGKGEKNGPTRWQPLTSTNHFCCFKNERSVCFCNTNIQNTHFCFIFVFLEKHIPTLIFLSSLKSLFSDSWSHIMAVWWLCRFAGGYYKLYTLYSSSRPQMIHNFLGYYYSAT